ncbi:MAG TPA: 4-alpha-glucanotransferase [Acidobacteriota bacterium]|nr:4-alpha-glucanotransferase [Acidobacteriota bacterium]
MSEDLSGDRRRPRRAGVLLHPTSLPGRYGTGDLGSEAIRFLDWAAAAGFRIWQVLPLGPTYDIGSPYGELSVFAGNPLLISPERMAAEGLLPPGALEVTPDFPVARVEFPAVRAWKETLLRRSWDTVRAGGTEAAPAALEEARAWASDPSRSGWLGDWTLYAALKERHDGAEWPAWDPPLARREPGALAEAAKALAAAREYHAYVQWLFARQWGALHAAARSRGISILGDLPIYPAPDSAEVWARLDLFRYGPDGFPDCVAGVPPDYFSATGQLWGNPLYRWDRCEAEGFAWWIERVRATLERCDLLRLDHFRGFAAYWAVPAGATSAIEGRWEPGPGMRFFEALRRALGALPLIAEDLGDIDDHVRALLRDSGLPGMRVLQFGLLDPSSTHHPAHHPEHAVVYTGTHDNDTARGWAESLTAEEGVRLHAALGLPEDASSADVVRGMIRVAMESRAELAIVPMQDVLGLGSEARMNLPAEPEGNWAWRMREGDVDAGSVSRLGGVIAASRRSPAGL